MYKRQVLADQHLAVFAIDLQHIFSTFRALGPGQVIMPEFSVPGFNLLNQSLCVMLNLIHKVPDVYKRQDRKKPSLSEMWWGMPPGSRGGGLEA